MSKTEELVIKLYEEYQRTDLVAKYTNLSEYRVVSILIKFGYIKD